MYVHLYHYSLYYITFASNYKNNVYTNTSVFPMQRLWEGWYIWHRLFFWLPLSVFLNFLIFIESHENTIVEFLNGNAKIYLWDSPIHCSSS